jgi:hypothetical protein
VDVRSFELKPVQKWCLFADKNHPQRIPEIVAGLAFEKETPAAVAVAVARAMRSAGIVIDQESAAIANMTVDLAAPMGWSAGEGAAASWAWEHWISAVFEIGVGETETLAVAVAASAADDAACESHAAALSADGCAVTAAAAAEASKSVAAG